LVLSEDNRVMITDRLLDVVFGVVNWMVGLFPANTLELSLGSGAGYLTWVGEVVNLGAFSWALGIIVAGESSLFVIRSVRFIWRIVWS
jgi:hypothetical protein